jgi:hypothetical protein
MKRRRRFWLLLALLLLVVGGLLIVPAVRWPIYGWLKGEAFYQGMPTSYWRERIQNHLEARLARLRGVERPWIIEAMGDLGISIENPVDWPDVLGSDEPAAVPVLIELLAEDDDGRAKRLWRQLDALNAIDGQQARAILQQLDARGTRLTSEAREALEELAKPSQPVKE